MSKKECNTTYRKMAHAKAMTVAIPKTCKVGKIFMRKPYSCSNYATPKEEKDDRGVQVHRVQEAGVQRAVSAESV